MFSAVTEGVEVRVESSYLEKNSEPSFNKFLFSYEVTIINNNPFPVQLLKRSWTIRNALGHRRFVHGEGVVGEQPIIGAGETYQYHSYCDLFTSLGWMEGHYLFRREDNSLMEIEIPRFQLAILDRLN